MTLCRSDLASRVFCVLCGILIVMLPAVPVHAATAQTIAKHAFAATVLLVMEDANGQPTALGSGFFVESGEIATNVHVIQGASRGYAKLIGETATIAIEGISAIDSQHDLVLLKVDVTTNQSLPISSSGAAEVGEPVYAVGNPEGLEGTFSQGIISAIRTVGTDQLLQITAPISPGSSGGPVLDGEGDIVGVSVATYHDGQNLNFAVPAKYLSELIRRIGPAMPLQVAMRTSAARSMSSAIGAKGTEGVIGTAFTYDGSNGAAYGRATGQYSFSLINQLREPVQNIVYVVVFYDSKGQLIDSARHRHIAAITGGLAKRVSGRVDPSVENLNNPTPPFPDVPVPPRRPRGRVDIRVLSFETATTAKTRESGISFYDALPPGAASESEPSTSPVAGGPTPSNSSVPAPNVPPAPAATGRDHGRNNAYSIGAGLGACLLWWPVAFLAVKGSLKLQYKWRPFLLGFFVSSSVTATAYALATPFLARIEEQYSDIGFLGIIRSFLLPLVSCVLVALALSRYFRVGVKGVDDSSTKTLSIHEPITVQRKEAAALLGALCADGEDCDTISGAKGRFGSEDNPIPVNGSIGELKYLAKLRGRSGEAVMFHRVGSFQSKVVPHPIDGYEVVCMDGTQWGHLFFDMYHPRRSNLAPEGYTLVPYDPRKKADSPFGFGVNGIVAEFPHQLPAAILQLFGESRGAPYARTVAACLQKHSFIRPATLD